MATLTTRRLLSLASLGVVEPYMSGVGGYGALVVYDAQTGQAQLAQRRNQGAGDTRPCSVPPAGAGLPAEQTGRPGHLDAPAR